MVVSPTCCLSDHLLYAALYTHFMQLSAAASSAVYLLPKAPPPDDNDKHVFDRALNTLMQHAKRVGDVHAQKCTKLTDQARATC